MRFSVARQKMETKHEKNYSQDNDEIVSNRTLRAGEVNSRRGNSTKQARTICNKFRPGYNGATNVDSNSLNQNGEVTMSNNMDTKLEVMQVQVDSNEKVVNAGLAGHKAELAGYKLNVDGRFEAALERMDANHKAAFERMDANQKVAFERMDADRKIADAKHNAAMERMDADRKIADAKHNAAMERMDADRKVSDAKHKAAMERMDANHKVALERIDGNQRTIDVECKAIRTENKVQFESIRTENKVQFESIRTEMNENKASMKLWFIGTIATILAVAAGLITATIAIIKAISDSQ